MPFLEHDGIQFYYELSGEGPPLVLCHGLTGNLENPKELFGWIPGYRQLVWDARGHGKTRPAGPASHFNFEVFARDLAALLDHLGIEEAVAGGVSMGAAVSAKFALLYPERVRGLLLIRPAWLTEPLPEGLRLYPVAADYIARFGPEKGAQSFRALPEYQSMAAQYPDAAANLLAQFFEDSALDRRCRLEGIPNNAPIRNWEEVAALRMPVLVVGNEPDLVHPLAYARAWAEHLPHARFVQVPPKSVDVELYAQSVRAHVVEFLASLNLSKENVCL
jgi:pimeloyl-ACP methyl ester carboxylesterase